MCPKSVLSRSLKIDTYVPFWKLVKAGVLYKRVLSEPSCIDEENSNISLTHRAYHPDTMLNCAREGLIKESDSKRHEERSNKDTSLNKNACYNVRYEYQTF